MEKYRSSLQLGWPEVAAGGWPGGRVGRSPRARLRVGDDKSPLCLDSVQGGPDTLGRAMGIGFGEGSWLEARTQEGRGRRRLGEGRSRRRGARLLCGCCEPACRGLSATWLGPRKEVLLQGSDGGGSGKLEAGWAQGWGSLSPFQPKMSGLLKALSRTLFSLRTLFPAHFAVSIRALGFSLTLPSQGRKWCANETRRKRKPSGVGAASSPSPGLSNGPEGEVVPPTPGTCETKRSVGWQKRNLNTLQPPPLDSRNQRARLRGNLPGGSRFGPRDRPDRSPQLRARRCGPARSGPSSSATRASAPLGSGGGRGGPTIPFWLRGRAGRGERAEIIFCLVVSTPVPSPRDARDGRRCGRREAGAGTRGPGTHRAAERARAGIEHLLCAFTLYKRIFVRCSLQPLSRGTNAPFTERQAGFPRGEVTRRKSHRQGLRDTPKQCSVTPGRAQ
ncbi:hypothetical protein H8959_018890 [Pygathrix nigripes]